MSMVDLSLGTLVILRFQKLDLVVKVDGWNIVFRVESQVSAEVQTTEPLSSESENWQDAAQTRQMSIWYIVGRYRTLGTWLKVCVGGCRAVARWSC